jgi:hypothetical protein
VSDELLASVLAERVMGWKTFPNRFMTSERSWIPRARFRPLIRLEDAFALLDRAATSYTLKRAGNSFTAEVRVGRLIGRASGRARAATITLAVAQALGLAVPTRGANLWDR